MDDIKPQVITCQYCQALAPVEGVHCPNCGQPLPRHLLVPGEEVCVDYQIVRLIGYGGMGEVYLAQHHLTGQLVAIKVLALHLAEEVDLRIRFLDEARILARLDHPNIVMLHNFKQERERMHIIMQYVDGDSLDRIVERDGPMDAESASLLFAPLADALNHAHENAIIHRDLKPSNILVDKTGKPRLTDFGIAKLTEGGANLTRTGTRVGTSWFMSPEQGLNKPADSRSDIYALGVTLYNSLTGKLPFGGDSEYEVIKGHVELPPPPIYSGEDPLDRSVEQVVMRALAKDPETRYQTGNAMRDALLEAVTTFGSAMEVRASPDGKQVFAIQKDGATVRANGGETGAAVDRHVTTLDPVEELTDLEAVTVENPMTPPLGSISRVGAAGEAPLLNGEAAAVVPMATQPPRPRPEVVDGARLHTPPGRPPAPGIDNVVTGVLIDEGASEALPEAPADVPPAVVVQGGPAPDPPGQVTSSPAEQTAPAEPASLEEPTSPDAPAGHRRPKETLDFIDGGDGTRPGPLGALADPPASGDDDDDQ